MKKKGKYRDVSLLIILRYSEKKKITKISKKNLHKTQTQSITANKLQKDLAWLSVKSADEM